jgi:lipoate-protein ligase A
MRVIDTDLADPAFTAAVDETILETAISGGPPTLHLYRRSPASVTMGYFLKARENVDLEFCKENGIKVIRRMSGGGAIFTDERQLVYGLAARGLPEAPGDCFSVVLTELAHAISKLGCECRFSSANDLVIDNRKVSGSAIVNKGATKLIHGTLLVDFDREIMFRALKVPEERLRTKGLGDPGERVTSLTEATGKTVPMEDVKAAVVEAMAAVVGTRAENGALTDDEVERAKELVRVKYGTDEWNLKS